MSTPTNLARATRVRDRAPSFLPSAAAGLASFVLGYLATWVVAGPQIRETMAGAVPAWKAAGWYYYAAHFVDLVATRSAGPFSGTGTVDPIASAEANLGLLYAVPPAVLVLSGLGVAVWQGLDRPGPAALGGALVALGYGAAAVVGAVLVPHTAAGTVFGVEVSSSIGPQLAGAVLLAGVIYPVVFGAIGGAVGSVAAGR